MGDPDSALRSARSELLHLASLDFDTSAVGELRAHELLLAPFAALYHSRPLSCGAHEYAMAFRRLCDAARASGAKADEVDDELHDLVMLLGGAGKNQRAHAREIASELFKGIETVKLPFLSPPRSAHELEQLNSAQLALLLLKFPDQSLRQALMDLFFHRRDMGWEIYGTLEDAVIAYMGTGTYQPPPRLFETPPPVAHATTASSALASASAEPELARSPSRAQLSPVHPARPPPVAAAAHHRHHVPDQLQQAHRGTGPLGHDQRFYDESAYCPAVQPQHQSQTQAQYGYGGAAVHGPPSPPPPQPAAAAAAAAVPQPYYAQCVPSSYGQLQRGYGASAEPIYTQPPPPLYSTQQQPTQPLPPPLPPSPHKRQQPWVPRPQRAFVEHERRDSYSSFPQPTALPLQRQPSSHQQQQQQPPGLMAMMGQTSQQHAPLDSLSPAPPPSEIIFSSPASQAPPAPQSTTTRTGTRAEPVPSAPSTSSGKRGASSKSVAPPVEAPPPPRARPSPRRLAATDFFGEEADAAGEAQATSKNKSKHIDKAEVKKGKSRDKKQKKDVVTITIDDSDEEDDAVSSAVERVCTAPSRSRVEELVPYDERESGRRPPASPRSYDATRDPPRRDDGGVRRQVHPRPRSSPPAPQPPPPPPPPRSSNRRPDTSMVDAAATASAADAVSSGSKARQLQAQRHDNNLRQMHMQAQARARAREQQDLEIARAERSLHRHTRVLDTPRDEDEPELAPEPVAKCSTGDYWVKAARWQEGRWRGGIGEYNERLRRREEQDALRGQEEQDHPQDDRVRRARLEEREREDRTRASSHTYPYDVDDVDYYYHDRRDYGYRDDYHYHELRWGGRPSSSPPPSRYRRTPPHVARRRSRSPARLGGSQERRWAPVSAEEEAMRRAPYQLDVWSPGQDERSPERSPERHVFERPQKDPPLVAVPFGRPDARASPGASVLASSRDRGSLRRPDAPRPTAASEQRQSEQRQSEQRPEGSPAGGGHRLGEAHKGDPLHMQRWDHVQAPNFRAASKPSQAGAVAKEATERSAPASDPTTAPATTASGKGTPSAPDESSAAPLGQPAAASNEPVAVESDDSDFEYSRCYNLSPSVTPPDLSCKSPRPQLHASGSKDTQTQPESVTVESIQTDRRGDAQASSAASTVSGNMHDEAGTGLPTQEDTSPGTAQDARTSALDTGESGAVTTHLEEESTSASADITADNLRVLEESTPRDALVAKTHSSDIDSEHATGSLSTEGADPGDEAIPAQTPPPAPLHLDLPPLDTDALVAQQSRAADALSSCATEVPQSAASLVPYISPSGASSDSFHTPPAVSTSTDSYHTSPDDAPFTLTPALPPAASGTTALSVNGVASEQQPIALAQEESLSVEHTDDLVVEESLGPETESADAAVTGAGVAMQVSVTHEHTDEHVDELEDAQVAEQDDEDEEQNDEQDDEHADDIVAEEAVETNNSEDAVEKTVEARTKSEDAGEKAVEARTIDSEDAGESSEEDETVPTDSEDEDVQGDFVAAGASDQLLSAGDDTRSGYTEELKTNETQLGDPQCVDADFGVDDDYYGLAPTCEELAPLSFPGLAQHLCGALQSVGPAAEVGPSLEPAPPLADPLPTAVDASRPPNASVVPESTETANSGEAHGTTAAATTSLVTFAASVTYSSTAIAALAPLQKSPSLALASAPKALPLITPHTQSTDAAATSASVPSKEPVDAAANAASSQPLSSGTEVAPLTTLSPLKRVRRRASDFFEGTPSPTGHEGRECCESHEAEARSPCESASTVPQKRSSSPVVEREPEAPKKICINLKGTGAAPSPTTRLVDTSPLDDSAVPVALLERVAFVDVRLSRPVPRAFVEHLLSRDGSERPVAIRGLGGGSSSVTSFTVGYASSVGAKRLLEQPPRREGLEISARQPSRDPSTIFWSWSDFKLEFIQQFKRGKVAHVERSGEDADDDDDDDERAYSSSVSSLSALSADQSSSLEPSMPVTPETPPVPLFATSPSERLSISNNDAPVATDPRLARPVAKAMLAHVQHWHATVTAPWI